MLISIPTVLLIYFKKIQDFLKKGYQVLVLLPEIALTNQIKERFKECFGSYPALWHSDISEKNKRLIWHGIANHKINLVLGARSSLFLPFKKLGLIIIDEEHDQSYKQEDQVVYNARDMAVLMASIKKISVILVSATPSIETYYNTVNKKFSYISLDKRYNDAELPEVKFVDLKKNPPIKSKFISPSIIPELKNILEKANQILFFLNRRGYSTFVICSKCGYRFNCPHCSVSLIYHKETNKLICHYCDHQASLERKCKDGDNCKFSFYGLGVEKIFNSIDKDSDGKITKDEFYANPLKDAATRFDNTDTNKDGTVTLEEENAAIAKLKKLEADAKKKQAEQKKDPAPKK